MAIYKNGNPIKIYKGDYHIAQFYKGNVKYAGWKEVTSTGKSINVINTYNDVIDITKIDGASYQLITIQGKNNCPTSFSEWESGEYDGSTGAKAVNASRIRLKRLIAVTPSVQYYLNANDTDSVHDIKFVIRAYDVNGAYLRNRGVIENGSLLTIASDEFYIGIFLYSVDGTTTYSIFQTDFTNGTIKPFICLNSETNKTYQAFTPNSPSPDYPAPITNANNFDVVACGKNLLPKATDKISYGITMSVSSDGTITLNGTATNTFVFNIPMNLVLNGTYCISANNLIVNAQIILRLISTDVEVMTCALSSINALATKSFTNQYISNLNIRIGTGQVLSNFTIKPQLEAGVTDTSYEPYKSNQVNIPYELSKLLNGVSDTLEYIGDGKDKKTQKINEVIVNGTEGYTLYSSDDTYLTAYYTVMGMKKSLANNLLCDKFKPLTSVNNLSEGIFGGLGTEYGTLFIKILKSRLATQDIAGLKTWLASNPLTVQYELATPIETITTNLSLTSYGNITNIITNSNPQVDITIKLKTVDI